MTVLSPSPKTKPCVVLSVDPGATCGLAVLDLSKPDRDGRLVATRTEPFDFVYEHIGSLASDDAAVVIEDTRALPIYARNRLRGRAREKAIRDVGRIDAMTDLIEARCKGLGLPVLCVEPPGGKWDDERFRLLTGAQGRSNQHVRDAARNAWFLTPTHIKALTEV